MTATISSIVRHTVRKPGPTKSARSAGARKRQPCEVVPLHETTTLCEVRQAFQLYTMAAGIDEIDPATAMTAYNRAIELDPLLAIAYTNRANLHYRDGRLEQAKDGYREALAIDPNQPEALYNLGYIDLEAGRYTQAISLMRRAIAADPAFADCHFNLAMAYEYAGLPDFARYHWRAYTLNPANDRDQWLTIAQSHLT